MGMTELYNKNSKFQFRTIGLSIPFVQQASDMLDVDRSSLSPLIIADFGSAHEANSIYAIKTIIDYTDKKIR